LYARRATTIYDPLTQLCDGALCVRGFLALLRRCRPTLVIGCATRLGADLGTVWTKLGTVSVKERCLSPLRQRSLCLIVVGLFASLLR
jgi:hypothetical protein